MCLESKRVLIRGLSTIVLHPGVNPRAKKAAVVYLLMLARNKQLSTPDRKAALLLLQQIFESPAVDSAIKKGIGLVLQE
jgi:hypothetical protein